MSVAKRERLLTARDVARHPLVLKHTGGRPLPVPTVARWMRKGVLGVLLECEPFGPTKRLTNERALRIFIQNVIARGGEYDVRCFLAWTKHRAAYGQPAALAV